MAQVLLVDPDVARREQVARALETRSFQLVAHDPAQPPGNVLRGVDVVLVGLCEDAVSVVDRFRQADPLVPAIVYSSSRIDASTAAALGRAGAYDFVFVAGDADVERIAQRIEDASRRQAIRRRELPVAVELLGTSQKIAQVRRYIAKAAQSDANVLITGESGTGKELVARAVHVHGGRRDGPFLAINCSAIPETLLESELFGHERGAFTGAVSRTRGKFEQAEAGTLFFDEVAEMPLALQSKLLRVMQPPPGGSETIREFTRIGSEQACRADVRVIFATHRDLAEEVKAGRFREDLYQRIHVLAIHVPPLRSRREDVPLLARNFLERYGELEGQRDLRFDPVVLEVLTGYDYPLNVRELEGIVRSLVVMKETGSTVVLGDLPRHLFGGTTALGERSKQRLLTLDEVEREHVRHVMDQTGGNKSKAARILGISRPALDRKLERMGGGVERAAGTEHATGA